MIQEAISLIQNQWLGLLVAVVGFYLLSNYLQKGLYRVPGPWYRGFSTLPRILSVYNNKSHEDDILLHRKYGKMVRLAPNLLSISDPAEINQIYGIGTKFYKSKFYSLSEAHDEEGLVPDPFILTDKVLHTRMKKNAANAYSLNGLVQMEPWIDPVAHRLLKVLDSRADGQAFDIADLLKNFAMDAVFSLTFGRDFNYMEKGDVLRMHYILDIASDYMAIFGQIPWIHRILLSQPFVARLVFGGGDKEEADMIGLATSEVKAAKLRTSEEGPTTFLQKLLFNQRKEPASMNDREVMTHAFGNISAGSDTTAIALRSTLYNVLKHPEVYQRLCEEVREKLTLPVKFVESNKLPYLSAVIHEAMRIHPSVGMILARYVPIGGAKICGYNLPAGTQLGINPWVLHRDPVVFPDPDRFQPERWLTKDEEHLRQMNRSFFTFGHGAHTCSGRWISLMEVTKTIPTLLLRFDMTLVDGGRDFTFKNRWFTPQKGLMVRLKSRDV